jgi:hypothetical protein
MHENRETSSLAASSKGSPAGKGQSRNASMNGGEESHRVEVPMKRANNEAEQQAATAESGKGANFGDGPLWYEVRFRLLT